MKLSDRLGTALEYALTFLGIFWIIWLVEFIARLNFGGLLGIYPRTINGLLGVITSPLVHGDFQHLLANSIPFGVLCTLLFFFYKEKALLIFALNWITAGLLTWLIGRPAYHIGASGVIYALASFLIFGGILSRKFSLIIASAIVIIAYSGLIWGVFPTSERVSWEGHLSGAIGGFIWAYAFRKAL